jgi:hypothetical protein
VQAERKCKFRLAIFRGAAYLQAAKLIKGTVKRVKVPKIAKQVKGSASREKMQVSTNEDNGKNLFSIIKYCIFPSEPLPLCDIL